MAKFSGRLPAMILLACSLGAAACGDPTGLSATEPTSFEDEIIVYALTGTPTGFPTALSTPAQAAVAANALLQYDLVFDINAAGNAVIYPMELVAWNQLEIHRVGLLKASGTFDDYARAPLTGFTYDEPMEVSVGDVIVVESNDPRVCAFPYPIRLYSKLGIDAIDPVNRSVRFRMTLNPNCGFRSLAPGFPEN